METHKTCPNFDVESWWRGRTQAATGDELAVAVPTVALTASPTSDALETELLFGESAKVLEKIDGHARVILETDGYEGWVKADMTLRGDGAAHASAMLRGHLRSCVARRDVTVTDAALDGRAARRQRHGRRLASGCASRRQRWLDSGDRGTPLDSTEDDFVSVAERFLGLPYLWGGRSAAGLDCSALVQLSLQAVGVACPRNSGDQYEWAKSRRGTKIIDRRDTHRGDLVFWPGHVGLCSSETAFLHANAHHHAVAAEATKDALLRTDAASKAEGVILRLAL